jgi:hypothetical protein
LPSAARQDGCIVDARRGHEGTCIPTDGNPDRCTPGRDARGRSTCIDSDPVCGACQMTFDTCIANNRCYGIICF